jgi:GxxExxY protein
LHVEIENPIPITYDGIVIDAGHRADLLGEHQVVVETKSVTRLLSLFRAQLVSQLRMGMFPVGLVINFHVERLKDGILSAVV